MIVSGAGLARRPDQPCRPDPSTLSAGALRPYPLLMRVAVCQLNARDDRKANLAAAEALLERAAAAGADLAVLPEYVDYLGPTAGLPEPEPVDGEVGSSSPASPGGSGSGWWPARSTRPARTRPAPGTPRWSSTVPAALAASYRKIHLYDVEIPGRVSYRESATVAPGRQTGGGRRRGLRVGLSICYDLRFPELYRRLAFEGGAQLLVVPAAFMMHTGRDHWEVLLRARAIENQCFVAAAGQTGDHEPGRTCFGRSMVVDPWGTVLGQVPDGPGLTVATWTWTGCGRSGPSCPAWRTAASDARLSHPQQDPHREPSDAPPP